MLFNLEDEAFELSERLSRLQQNRGRDACDLVGGIGSHPTEGRIARLDGPVPLQGEESCRIVLLEGRLCPGRVRQGQKGQKPERLFGEVDAGGLDVDMEELSVEAPKMGLPRLPGSLRPGVVDGNRLSGGALPRSEKKGPKGCVRRDERILGGEEAKGKRAPFENGPAGSIREIRRGTLRSAGRNVRSGRAHGPDGSLNRGIREDTRGTC